MNIFRCTTLHEIRAIKTMNLFIWLSKKYKVLVVGQRPSLIGDTFFGWAVCFDLCSYNRALRAILSLKQQQHPFKKMLISIKTALRKTIVLSIS